MELNTKTASKGIVGWMHRKTLYALLVATLAAGVVSENRALAAEAKESKTGWELGPPLVRSRTSLGPAEFSPDGRFLAVMRSHEDYKKQPRELCVLDAAGQREIHSWKLHLVSKWFVWSSDSRHLVAPGHLRWSVDDGRGPLFVCSVEDGSISRITPRWFGAWVFALTAAPCSLHEGRIAVEGKRRGATSDSLWVTTVQGGDLVNISPDDPCGAIGWVPDGSAVLYGQYDDKQKATHFVTVSTKPPFPTEKLAKVPGVALVRSWSPDGSKCLYDCTADGKRDSPMELHIFKKETPNSHIVVHHGPVLGLTSWSPSGRRLAFRVEQEMDGLRSRLRSMKIGVWDESTQQVSWAPLEDIYFSGLSWRNEDELLVVVVEDPEMLIPRSYSVRILHLPFSDTAAKETSCE
jgi:hypothetical protein